MRGSAGERRGRLVGMKLRSILVLPGFLIVAACSTSSPKASDARVQPAVASSAASADASLVASAAQFVAASTGIRPDNALVFHTTREKAATVVDASDAGRPAGAPATVILFSGHFIDHDARVPPGSNAVVAGDEISLVYDESGQSTDFGVEPKPVDTSAMGNGTRVSVAGPSADDARFSQPIRDYRSPGPAPSTCPLHETTSGGWACLIPVGSK